MKILKLGGVAKISGGQGVWWRTRKFDPCRRENFKQASGTVVASCYITTYEGLTVVPLMLV
jgi:hypothetical protein